MYPQGPHGRAFAQQVVQREPGPQACLTGVLEPPLQVREDHVGRQDAQGPFLDSVDHYGAAGENKILAVLPLQGTFRGPARFQAFGKAKVLQCPSVLEALLSQGLSGHGIAEGQLARRVDPDDSFMEGIDHVLEPGRVFAVTAAGLGDVGRFLEGPFQGLVARTDHDARAVVGLRDGDADAAPHDAAGALGDGLGDAQGQFPGVGETDRLQADVQQAGEQFRPGGGGVIACHGHIVRIFAGVHQGLEDGHMAPGDGDDGLVQVTAQEFARPAAAQDHVHALVEQLSCHGQGVFHGGKADLFQRPAVFLGIRLDLFCHHSGVGNESEGKGSRQHNVSCSDGIWCGPSE